MDWYDITANRNQTVNSIKIFPELAGIINDGRCAWLVHNYKVPTLQIISLYNDKLISIFDFANTPTFYASEWHIRFVEELYPGNLQNLLLAVSVEEVNKTNPRNAIALYSVQHNCLLQCIELRMHISCLSYVDAKCCRETFFKNFDGCLSVGTQEGTNILLDLNIKRLLSNCEKQLYEKTEVHKLTQAYVINCRYKLTDIFIQFSKCRQADRHLGLQMEAIESPCAICCVLPIQLVFGLAVGFADGRLALYDLKKLNILIVLKPPQAQYAAPLKRMNYFVPSDDRQPGFYIGCLYENGKSLSAALHFFMYKERVADSDHEGSYLYANFLRVTTRLSFVLEDTNSTIIGCQAIATVSGEHAANSLFVMAWHNKCEDKHKLVIFDLNQWCKESMPETVDCRTRITYLVGYILNGKYTGLHVQIKKDTIANYNSMQRCKEHFYPNSLSFDCTVLAANGCRLYNWLGAQNRFINMLRFENATIFLEPRPYHDEILRTHLVPQFCEQQESKHSNSAVYELILSVALEHNCYSLLRDCARCWADGSFNGNLSWPTNLSLSTLTNWIDKRANQIKQRCHVICAGNVQTLDQSVRQELDFITRQLRKLSNLQTEILHFCEANTPDCIFAALSNTANALIAAADYQEVLNWCLSNSLLSKMLPAEHAVDHNVAEAASALCYPFKELKQYYAARRTLVGCRLLYIDALLVHYELAAVLQAFWSETDGIYPPSSIAALLRVMLAPGVQFEQKASVLLYFLFDLNIIMLDQFQSVFKLSATLVKTVEAFWCLDHARFTLAVEHFLTPINNTQNCASWLVELFVEALLAQNAANLALDILQARPCIMRPMLKLKALLCNEMIAEAFHFARIRQNESNEELWLVMFFLWFIYASKAHLLHELMLNGDERQTLQRLLIECNTQNAEIQHFTALLEKSNYSEALNYMDTILLKHVEGSVEGCDLTESNSVDQQPNFQFQTGKLLQKRDATTKNQTTTTRCYNLRRTSQPTTTATNINQMQRVRTKFNNTYKKPVQPEKTTARFKRGSAVLASTDSQKDDTTQDDVTFNMPLTRARQRLDAVSSDVGNTPAVHLTPRRQLRSRRDNIEPKSTKRHSRC